MSGGFRRSGRFGLIGVLMVIIVVALIALNADSTDPNPKGTMALIFGVIAVFVVILFALQRSDLERGLEPPQPEARLGGDGADLSHGAADLPSKASCRC